jgi:TonB family protein
VPGRGSKGAEHWLRALFSTGDRKEIAQDGAGCVLILDTFPAFVRHPRVFRAGGPDPRPLHTPQEHPTMRVLAVFLALMAAAPAAAQMAPPDTARIFELTEVEVLPRPRNPGVFTESLAKGYPAHLRAAGVGGTVQVEFIVGPDGWPVNVRVLSSPDSAFIIPSIRAVLLLQFSPAQVQGRPVFVRVEQPITWRTESAAVDVCEHEAHLAEGEYELCEVEELPRPRNSADFQRVLARNYPLGSDQPAVGAIVQVRFRLEENGMVSVPSVTRSSDSRFNEATLLAVRAMRFRPARLNGRPVKVWIDMPIQWVPPSRR